MFRLTFFFFKPRTFVGIVCFQEKVFVMNEVSEFVQSAQFYSDGCFGYGDCRE